MHRQYLDLLLMGLGQIVQNLPRGAVYTLKWPVHEQVTVRFALPPCLGMGVTVAIRLRIL